LYSKAYEDAISPCLGEKHWPQKEIALDPPKLKVMLGRPRKKRIKDP